MFQVKKLLLLLFISLNSYADYQDGLDAYNRGDYKTAFNEWLLADEGGGFSGYTEIVKPNSIRKISHCSQTCQNMWQKHLVS